jgi:hypothetical protein
MSKYLIKAGLNQTNNAFVNSYGSYSNNYSLVNPSGRQVTSVFLWILIGAFILGALFAFINTRIPKDKKENNNIIKYLSKFFVGILILAFATCGFSVAYLFIYWIVYKLQYFQWFADLPNAARISHAAMKATRSFISK